MLRPGVEVVAEASGGLHRLMAWDRPILTDSGGYQVFSLERIDQDRRRGRRVRQPHRRGPRPPERGDRHRDPVPLGSDIIMCFDECTPFPVEEARLQRGRGPNHRMGKTMQSCPVAVLQFGQVESSSPISPTSPTAQPPTCFSASSRAGPISIFAAAVPSRSWTSDSTGMRIGGLSVGEGHEEMVKTVRYTAPLLPAGPSALPDGRRHAGGHPGGGPGRRGHVRLRPADEERTQRLRLHCRHGALRLRNSMHIDSTEPVEPGCDCYCCRHFTRGAIRHFFNCGEMLGPDPAVHPQSEVLSEAHGRDSRAHRAGRLRHLGDPRARST